MKSSFIFVFYSLFNLITGELVPFGNTPYSLPDHFLPNAWSSITNCPLRYFDLGYEDFALPASGQPAYDREFAHMAAIGWTDDSGEINWNCGGSLISLNFVLTAAHCAFWRDRKPDVVRLGDLDLATTNGDKYAQQYSIVDVILHPSYTSRYRYHDIALLKLNASVKLHPTVCPACLWVNSTVDFRSVEACGYGQTGIFEEKTPILLKVTLSPVSTSACSEHHQPDRKLNKGLQDSQICAVDPEFKQDTCPGDSGGPLQMKLLGFDKLNPFVIGITSFGKSCGTESPGVYTRVSSYIDWIEEVTKEDFNPLQCALRYLDLREWEWDVVIWKGDESETIDQTRAHFDRHPDKYGYRAVTDPGNCGVIFIHEEYILTTASCIYKTKPEIVIAKDGTSFQIFPPIIHYLYKPGSTNHDVALIKLKSSANFNFKGILPACLWTKEALPKEELEVTGFGTIRKFYFNGTFDLDVGYTKIRSPEIPITECQSFYQEKGILVSDQSICYGNVSWHILPDTCSLDLGGPLGRLHHPDVKGIYFSYVMGLNNFGNDCGFGYPVVATKVSKYIDWIDSIIFGENQGLGQDCESPRGPGSCKFSSDCPAVVDSVKSGAPVTQFVCNFKNHANPLVCCPWPKSALDDCPHMYKNYRKNADFHGWMRIFKTETKSHYAEIKQSDGTHCYGALVSDQMVLAPITCTNKLPLTVKVGHPNCTNLPTIEVSKIEIISDTTSLLVLKEKLELSECVVPICIWTNPDKVPFDLVVIPFDHDIVPYPGGIVPYPPEKCDSKNLKKMDEKLGCAVHEYFSCDKKDKIQLPFQVVRNESGLVIPYLVGMGTLQGKEDCSKEFHAFWVFYYEKMSSIVESILRLM